MAVYASLVHGMDFPLWGAFGFSLESVRNKLQAALKEGDWLLSIGTSDAPTAPELQGRLLALIKVGRQQILTQEYVEPGHWQDHLTKYGGRARWPYGMPILTAEVFNPLPIKDQILPRIREENLHRKLANNYEKLTDAEAELVLSLPRNPAPEIFRARGSSFQAALLPRRPGPAPSDINRTVVPKAGPAATYLMVLDGTLAKALVRRGDLSIFKIGFSREPQQRLKALNCFYPKPDQLRWKIEAVQWHKDATNAYAMEQLALEFVHGKASLLSGEIYEGRLADAVSAFARAKRDSARAKVSRVPKEVADLMF